MRGQRIGWLFVVLVYLAGCSSDSTSAKPKPAPSAAAPTRREPGILAIRNKTGRMVQSISLEDESAPADGMRRVGSMSPVFQNITYTYVRPDNAPPLPRKLRLKIAYPREAPQSTVVDISNALSHFKGGRNEAIVFELKPDGSVATYVDQVEP